MKTQDALLVVLVSQLANVPPRIVVWKDDEGTEWTAAEMLTMLHCTRAQDVLLKWFNGIFYTTLLRYRENEPV